jgi:hypothetical protein
MQPGYTEDEILKFIGWLSVEITELNAVELPRLLESWKRYKSREWALFNTAPLAKGEG